MSAIIDWYKLRYTFYIAHFIGYFTFFLITGWDLYPHLPYLWHTLSHVIFSIPLLFVFSYFSIRLLLCRQKYFLFVLSGILFILISGLIAFFIYPVAGEPKINWTLLVANRLIFILIPSFIEIVLQNKSIEESQNKIEITEQILQLNQQINTHFLFNTLTTLHYQILTKSPKAELFSLKLKDLMEYSLVLPTNIWIAIENEVNFLRSYIDIEMNEIEDESRVIFHTQIVNNTVQVPTMTLIVFIENAFKHGDLRLSRDGFIEIVLDCDNEELNFQIKNSFGIYSQKDVKSNKIGLVNIRKRLNLMLPNRYEIRTNIQKNIFQLNLKILLKRN